MTWYSMMALFLALLALVSTGPVNMGGRPVADLTPLICCFEPPVPQVRGAAASGQQPAISPVLGQGQVLPILR
ncbi:MAG: hypothetical protein ABWZ98_04395 [Nakamurella sp.]